MRVEVDKGKGQTAVLFFRRDDVTPDIAEKTAEIRRLLKLPADGTRSRSFTPRAAARRGGWCGIAAH